jgi:hypothetical protein
MCQPSMCIKKKKLDHFRTEQVPVVGIRGAAGVQLRITSPTW